MSTKTRFRLRDADNTLRLFLTAFIVVLTAGYVIGIVFVDHTTSITPVGIEEQFLGTPETFDNAEMKFAKSSHEMFVFLHNHILSLSLVFFAVGGILYFSSIVSERAKRWLMVEPLVAVLTTFGGIALVRFVSPLFSWLVLLSGASLFFCYGLTVYFILKELWWTSQETGVAEL